jgi:hypothetical protein
VIVPDPDLELLLSNNILFGPIRVVFPLYLGGGDQVSAVDSFQRDTYFVISLDSTILLSSLTISGPIHTGDGREEGSEGGEEWARTLFPDQAIVAVVGVVCITKSSMTVLEFEKLVAVLSRMTGAGGDEGEKRVTH